MLTTILSDQKALKFLLEQREVQTQFQKWLTKLIGYDFKILYQPGLRNKAVHALLEQTEEATKRILWLSMINIYARTRVECYNSIIVNILVIFSFFGFFCTFLFWSPLNLVYIILE